MFKFLTGLALLSGVLGLYSAKDNVILADSTNFRSIVFDTDHAVLVEFFAPWCGHCRNLVPEMIKASKKLQGLAKIVAVDCDAELNKPLCGQFGIQGFPTLKIFSGGVKGTPQDYQGERKAKAIIDAILPTITSRNVFSIGGTSKKAVTFDDFLKKKSGEIAKVILVNKKSAIPPVFKALSVEFKKRLRFGEVKYTSKDIVDQLAVKDAPAVIVYPQEADSKPVIYDGVMKIAPLTEFLEKYALPAPKKKAKESKEKKESPKKAEKPKQEPPFNPELSEIIDQASFEKECGVDQTGVCILSFIPLESEYPESVQAHTTSLTILKALKKTFHDKKSSFNFVWINPVKRGGRLIRDLGVSDMFPSIVAINSKRKVYRNYRGGFEESAISSFLSDLMLGNGRNSQLSQALLIDEPKAAAKDEL